MSVRLKGMTWSHPRGFDPMVATAALWRQKTGVEICWDQRSLQDFESFPVIELARAFDLIVIDHPHVGQVTAEKCLVALDVPGREAERAALAAASVGPSYASYTWKGRQWALPIDAAAQVQAYRPDHLAGPLTRWEQILPLARAGRVVLPLRPPHNLMCLYTLMANLGAPCAMAPGQPFLDVLVGARAIAMLQEMAGLIGKANFAMDPIAASEAMAAADSPLAVMPLGYGYVSYALAGFRPARLAFADIPTVGNAGPIGSALGGTGIAVSAFSEHRQAGIDYSYWVAGEAVQAGAYAAGGGQPGHAAAWDNAAVNAPVGDFYKATRATLEGGYVRPRYNGYMNFQAAGADRLNAALRAGEDPRAAVAALNALFEESF